MRRLCLLLVVSGALVFFVGAAMAGNGTLRLSWDVCDPIIMHKDFLGEGTGQVATVVLSVIDCDEPNNGHRVKIALAQVEDAWRFDVDGCQAGQLQFSYSAVSETCPAFQGADPLTLTQYSYDSGTGYARLDIAVAYDDFMPDPMIRYSLWQAHFDHSRSATGPTDPTVTCGWAERSLCFYLLYNELELLLTDGTKRPFGGADNDEITWQNEYACPSQVESATWGRVKALYR